MGRKRLLAGGTTLLGNGQFCTFTWGPFSGPIRILGIWLDLGSTTQQNGNAGFFYGPDASAPNGAIGTAIAIPTGWTSLQDFSLFDGGSAVDDELYKFPWGTGATPLTFAMAPCEIDVLAVNFHLKCIVTNRTAAAADPHVFIAIEEDPPGLDATQIDVRPQPGFPPAPPPPTPPASTPPPIPQAPQQPDAGPTTANLPPPGPGAIPEILLDPRDPLTSALAIYKP